MPQQRRIKVQRGAQKMKARFVTLLILAVGGLELAHAADSTPSLTDLTTAGFLTGAADGCNVAPKESNALVSSMALAISQGKYGEQGAAHTRFNTGRQSGISDAAARKFDCRKIQEYLLAYVRRLQERADSAEAERIASQRAADAQLAADAQYQAAAKAAKLRAAQQSAKADALRNLMERGFTKEQAEGILAAQGRSAQ
jgi:hypothetical protein